MSSLAQVLAQTIAHVREQRDCLNEIDDELIHAIQHVENALSEIRPGVPVEVQYPSRRGGEPIQWLSFQKHNGAWRMMHAFGEAEKQSPLLGASRAIRADVFDARRTSNVAPVIALIEEMPRAICEIAKDRDAALRQARALCEALAALGFGRPTDAART